MREIPRALGPGDTAVVIAPAGRVDGPALEAGVETLRSRGLRVRVGKHVFDRYGHLAGSDRDRAADLMEAFLHPGVQGVFCARGGSGSARIIPYLDATQIAANPKIFVGYSDITTLHLLFARHGGWPTFYGPMVATELGDCAESPCFELLWRMISRAEPAGELPFFKANESVTLGRGTAEGRLLGGTLCVLESTLGTDYALRADGCLLALEDDGESRWRVDRMLTHLSHAGTLGDAAGFVIGSLSDEQVEGALTVEESLRDHLPAEKPSLLGFPFGHRDFALTLPLNCRARLDADARTLSVLEAGVRDG